ncbi:DUF5074 domain-containing protein [Algoriphagus sp. CAU 1675]|uniref:YncE family protein n=1 Tax=Algoriphagus sp. CAU 1675 TaxID=3032597 RepID=UPI0023DBACA7|nr:DUF5074 domain-containing protein [Algoriphagus sp. CAU 1675]MDF2159224.1 surface layer protein [Algoriphagus sp. CAU 1675]
MKFNYIRFSKVLALFFILFSCVENEPERPLGEYDSGILIMNEGSFGANDGEVYHLNPTTGTLKSDIFEAANGRPFAGLLEDLIYENDNMYLVANTGKVEVVNPGDFTSLGAVTSGLDQPRSLTVNSGKLFISDYGPYDQNYGTPDSYIAVVRNTLGGNVAKKISVSRKPEDMISFGKYILVAGSEESKVEVIDAEKEEVIKTIEVGGNPSVFYEAAGKIWLYSTGLSEVYFYSFHLDNFTLATTNIYPIANATGKIAFGNDDIMYLLTSSGWPDYNDGIAQVSVLGPELNPNWYSGSGFYGIGFDKNRGELYLANSNGFQGNGTITVLDENGSELRNLDSGRGPSGFMMR